MKSTGNTILVTGGGSGIGRALAEAFHKLGNTVIIAGRRKKLLDEVTAANPGMKALAFDAENPEEIHSLAERVREFPGLNVLINNAGIMRPENLRAGNLADAQAIITTNLLGPIRLIAALLPLIEKQAHGVIMNVTSGLAFVPLAMTPTYCATKAALHSYTESLRYQLKGTTTQVIELIPPWVATDLMGNGGNPDPRAMPLKDFIAEVMGIIQTQPEAVEICVERVKALRFAAESGKYATFFQGFNDALSASAH